MEKIHYSTHEYRTEYLKSEQWKQKSKFILNRDSVCKICDKRQSNDAHHLTYTSVGFEDLDKDLVGVCRPCHNRIHKYYELSQISDLQKLKEIFFKSKTPIIITPLIIDKLVRAAIIIQRIIAGKLKISISEFPKLLNKKWNYFLAQKIFNVLNDPTKHKPAHKHSKLFRKYNHKGSELQTI